MIQFSFEDNQIIIQSGTQTFNYFSDKVLTFSFYDKARSIKRVIYSLPYETEPGYRKRMFFELAHDDQVSLLLREKLIQNTYTDPMRPDRGIYTTYTLQNEFYLISPNGGITWVGNEKKPILEYFGRHSGIIKDYMKKERVNTQSRLDMIKTVEYYNSLVRD